MRTLDWLRPSIAGGERRHSFIADENDCWIWQGGKKGDGYGSLFWNGRAQPAHRVFYEELLAPIPEGLVLDHLCRVPACVNPLHLEPVTHRENILRGIGPSATTHRTNQCKRGHSEWKEKKVRGVYVRRCLVCEREYRAAHPQHHAYKRKTNVQRSEL